MQITIPGVRAIPRITRNAGRRLRKNWVRRYAGLLTIGVVLLVWHLLVMYKVLPPYQLPAPAAVWAEFIEWVGNGKIWPHITITLQEVLTGLFIGVGIALILGYFMAHSQVLHDLLSPVVVAFQSTPVVAYAPLLVIWFPGIASKVVTSSLIVFFPMLMSTVVGIRTVPDDLLDLMRVSQATRWQTFIKLEVPAAMPVLLAGLKTAATLSVIGAVVGELINGNAGLGHLVRLGLSQYDIPLVFVAVILLATVALTLYRIVVLLERRLLRWQQF
jgi:NitT/TauT family transport system permease protein